MSGPRRRFIVPEVIQTSAMDCGPASLKCMLEGFGISVSYGRLREACQTDVDGTSIDTMEEIAVQLGLDATQVMVPADYVFMPEAQALPALAVVRTANNMLHFVIIWRCVGNLVQVMDPDTGRRWATRGQMLDRIYTHAMPVAAASWREWASSDAFLDLVRARLAALSIARSKVRAACDRALADASWFSLATLDASARMVDTLVRSGAVRAGSQAARTFVTFFERASADPLAAERIIPDAYWSVRPGTAAENGEQQVIIRGAVLLTVQGRRSKTEEAEQKPRLSPELVAALAEKPYRPIRQLFRLLRADGLFAPFTLFLMLGVVAGALVIEGLLLRGMLDLRYALALPEQRLSAIALLVVFIAAIIGLQWVTTAGGYRVGRRLETRMRMAFLAKIPRLGDRYFSSRPISDMAERGHAIHRLRALPDLGRHLVQATAELAFTAVAIAWLVPSSASIVALAVLCGIGVPLATRQFIAELDLRVRTHTGALSRFYLDSLLGLIAIRTHGAEQSMRRAHENLLMEWAHAGIDLQRANMLSLGLQMAAGSAVVVWLIYHAVSLTSATSTTLLLVYWALNIPALAQEIALVIQEYPLHRNTTLRLLEPLGAPEPARMQPEQQARIEPDETAPAKRGMSVALDHVSVVASGHTILSDISLAIEPGKHVAVVGPSGAGKSTLVGLLLGWHKPANGHAVIDGEILDAAPSLAPARRDRVGRSEHPAVEPLDAAKPALWGARGRRHADQRSDRAGGPAARAGKPPAGHAGTARRRRRSGVRGRGATRAPGPCHAASRCAAGHSR
jgi:ABC-type bacteriocin/lantibiotic exporter with double-glycine peptidase domain